MTLVSLLPFFANIAGDSSLFCDCASYFGADLSYFCGSTSVHKTGTPTLCVLMTERREAGLLVGERREAGLLVEGRREA